MMKSDRQNSSFFWATTFLRELHDQGVKHIVISPGSRSTPLVMAASSHPGFRCRSVLDERSAAFIALGLGKATRIPAALVCTSGTAAANYLPAVIEARQSGIPMLLLTADRPPSLRNIGASQAIDQIKLFGDYPVFFHEAGEPVIGARDLNRLKQAAAQAFTLSRTRQGPAHINFPFRKPLEPEPDFVEQIKEENQRLEPDRNPTTISCGLEGKATLPQTVRELLMNARRPVVIAGPGHAGQPDLPVQLAALLKAPLLSEFPEQESDCLIAGFDGFLKNGRHRTKLEPDLIIRFGQQPVSKALQLFLQDHDSAATIHFADLEEWHDITGTVSHRVDWFGKHIDWKIETVSTDAGWLNRWKEIEKNFVTRLDAEIEQQSSLTDGHVFRHLIRKTPDNWNLFLSNSFPVRDRMLFGGSHPHRTFVNRGASGIDGVISTAIGVTLGSNKPGILFIGDLAALHDSNALLASRLLEQPLVVVLLNNGGGTIFRMLPIYRHKEVYKKFFETPQEVDFSSLAGSFGIGHHAISTLDELYKLDPARLAGTPGIHLVECKTDADASMNLRKTLWDISV